jgi:hypothetical protein
MPWAWKWQQALLGLTWAYARAIRYNVDRELILGMLGMKALVTVGAIPEFAGGDCTNFFHTAGMSRPALSGLYC